MVVMVTMGSFYLRVGYIRCQLTLVSLLTLESEGEIRCDSSF